MREIKFKAWDTANNRFYELVETRVPELNHGDDDGVIYLQYIGLKDKNGREVYEGDKVKAPDIFTEDQDANYSIKWNDSYARFMTWHESIGCCQFLYAFEGDIVPIGIDKNKEELDTRSIEVIGNIYENPELL